MLVIFQSMIILINNILDSYRVSFFQKSNTEGDNALIIYDTLEVKHVMNDCKEEVDENDTDIEIKEVYFGEYLNHCDTIEDENTVLINQDNPLEEPVSENVVDVQPVDSMPTMQANNPEDIQISQIVESSNVSLR